MQKILPWGYFALRATSTAFLDTMFSFTLVLTNMKKGSQSTILSLCLSSDLYLVWEDTIVSTVGKIAY